jgi:uncharacterized protein YjbK
LQENFFFDGPNRELNSRRVVLRVRFYDTDNKAVLTLKVCLVLAAATRGEVWLWPWMTAGRL